MTKAKRTCMEQQRQNWRPREPESWHCMVKGTGILSCCFAVSVPSGPQVSLVRFQAADCLLETSVSPETTMCSAVMISVWKQR